MTRRRVVVTGLGCVTPAGRDVPATWAALLEGRGAVTRVAAFEQAKCGSVVGAEAKDFDAEKAGSKQEMRRFGRATQFAVASCIEAWRDAGFAAAPPDLTRAGSYVGTAIGDGAETHRQGVNLMNRGLRAVHPLYVARCMSNAPPAHVSLELGLKGPTATFSSACASGATAIGMAMRAIQHGEADVMVAGGCEEMSCVMLQGGLDVAGLVSRRNDAPEKASRPFDRGRDGLVLGEGGAMVVLEEREHALKRGAKIVAEAAGFGQATDPGGLWAPAEDGSRIAVTLEKALADAGWKPDEVSLVAAEGAATVAGDRAEAAALGRVFGKRRPPVNSAKSILGHMIGASAALGFVVTALSCRDGRAHPTINCEEPEFDLDVVPGKAREMRVQRALVNSFGLGGACAALAVARHA